MSNSSKFSALKPGRSRRNVRTSQTSASVKSPKSIKKLKFTAHHAIDPHGSGSISSSSSLTAFEIKKEITSKQLQNEEICALTVAKNLIYLATKSGKISIFEERTSSSNAKSSTSQKSHVKHVKTQV